MVIFFTNPLIIKDWQVPSIYIRSKARIIIRKLITSIVRLSTGIRRNNIEVSISGNIDKNRKHDITLDEVREVPMFAHFTDEQAQEVIDSFKQLSNIIFNFYQKDKGNPSGNQ